MKRYVLHLVLCWMIFLSLFTPSPGSSAQEPTSANPPLTSTSGPHIRLAAGQFDPLDASGPAGLPDALQQSAYPGDGSGYYLVQFDGPVATADVDRLRAAGVQVFDYIPDFAFIVRMDWATQATVTDMPAVRWVGLYQPAYRLSPDLTARLFEPAPESDIPADERSDPPQALWGDGPVELFVSLFRGEPLDPAISQIEALGGQVLSQSQTAWQSKLRISISPDRLADLASLPGVRWIEQTPEWQLTNSEAADIMGVRPMWDTHGLHGQGQTIAVCDTGLDQGATSPASLHDDFEDGSGNSRVVAIHDLVGDGANDVNSGHGTHVAGSVLGNGALSGSDPSNHVYPNTAYAGMAPEANLVFQASEDNSSGDLSGLPDDLNQLFAQAAGSGASLHTNSWGSSVMGKYTSSAEEVDQYAWDHKEFTILFSAGNSGIDSDADGVIDLYSTGSPGTAKNCVTVGATENERPSGSTPTPGYDIPWGSGSWAEKYPVDPIYSDHVSDDPAGLAAFSSRGPTFDGRYKPDVVAPGTNIASTRSSLISGDGWGPINDFYMFNGGTSMSTPLVAGAATLVRQYYTDQGGIIPSAALIKATLANGAINVAPGQYGTGASQEIPNQRPNNVIGWGRVDIEDSLFPASPRTTLYEDETAGLNTGEAHTYVYTVTDSSEPLRVTLAWSDYPGSPAAAGSLVNDLDLSVTDPGGTIHYPTNAVQRGTSEHLIYDDGGASGYFQSSTGGFRAVRFTPSGYPATLQAGVFLVGSTSYPESFDWYVYDGDDTNGPNNVLASGSTTIRRAGWHVVDLAGAGVTINSGDFFLGLEVPNDRLAWFYDESEPISGRSWLKSSGAWENRTSYEYMFQAIVSGPADATQQDRVNNLVGVDIETPQTGAYTINVSGYNVPVGPQPYALVSSGALVRGEAPSNTPPTLADLPDQTVPMDGSADNAIDLWAYASDAESAADELTFSIYNSPSPSAGISLDGNRYVDINPAAGWTGSTDVTIRATDPGGMFDTSTFSLQVVEMLVWDGSASRDWHNPNNWTPARVPSVDDVVTIPDTANDPLISQAAASVKSLTLEPGASLDLGDQTLTAEEGVTNRGTLKQTRTVVEGYTAEFLRLTDQAGGQTHYYGVDLTPTAGGLVQGESGLAPEQVSTKASVGTPIPSLREPAASLADVELILDDGSQESGLVLRDVDTLEEFRAVIVNHLDASMATFPFSLERIDIHQNTNNLQGEEIQLLAYADADGGDLSNATLLHSEIVTVQTQAGWNVYTLTTPVIYTQSADVLIGFSTYYADGGVPWPYEDRYPYPMDETTPQNQSYMAWMDDADDPVDPSDLSSFPNLVELNDIGLPANWMIRGYGSLGIVDTPPTITDLPDQSLPLNGSADDAIDLWAYTNDADDPDADLSFSIANSPAPGAGVSLDANRYVDITPTAGWIGTTDVQIQVTDSAGLTDTDSFQVSVGAPDIAVDPGAFEETLLVDTLLTRSLTISNLGSLSLNWEIAEQTGTFTPALQAFMRPRQTVPAPAPSSPPTWLDPATLEGRNPDLAPPDVAAAAMASPQAPSDWGSGAPVPTGRNRLAGVTDQGCLLYAIGGRTTGGSYTDANKVYDPETDSWSSLTPLPAPRTNLAAAALNGTLFVPGGYNEDYLSTHEAYHVASDSWTSLAPLPQAVSGGVVEAVNGRVYHIGGNTNGGYIAANYEYNPGTDSWTTKAAAPGNFAYAASTVLDGKIYVAGGWESSSHFWRYDPASDSWTTLASMNQGRQSPGLVAAGGYIYAFGGGVGWDELDSVEQYDPASDSWTVRTDIPMSVGRLAMATGWVRGDIWAAAGSTPSTSYNTVNEYLDEGYPDNCGQDVPWLSETPISGTLPAVLSGTLVIGNETLVDVVFDATGLAAGDYSAGLTLSSNDPDQDPLSLPVLMHVVTVPLNTPPVLAGLPDQLLPAGGSADDAIDLWAHVEDAQDDAADLNFTIVNSPTAEAGVSIDANRYVDINPTAGWTGQTDVEIQAEDPGGLSDSDSFHLVVTGGAITNVTVSVAGDQLCAGRVAGVKRCYDLEAADPIVATVRFYFNEAERNGQTPADLVAYHYVGGWVEEPGPYTSGGTGQGQYVEAQNVDDFSPFALDTAGVGSNVIYLPTVMKGYSPVPNTPHLDPISNDDGDGNYSP